MIQYRDPCDPTRVCWKTFEDDIEQVFTVKELEKCPCLEVESPPREIEELKKKGTKDWQNVNPGYRDICEDSVHKIKQRLLKRGIMLKPLFRDYDK